MATWKKIFSKILLFGDSLTQQSFSPGGWGARVADHFQRKADVINRGFSGYNTEWSKIILPELLASMSERADVVTVFFGANDAVLPEPNPQQHVPLASFKSNLSEIVTTLNSAGINNSSIVFITPPPVAEDLWALECRKENKPMDRSNETAKQYAEAVLQLGRETGITTVDVYDGLSKEQNLKQFLSDGLHFTPEGNRFLADLVIPVLEAKLVHVQTVFPEWRAVNAECPKESFQLDN